MDLNVVCLQQEPIMKKEGQRLGGLSFGYSVDYYACAMSKKRCPFKKPEESAPKSIEIEWCDFGLKKVKW